MRFHFVKASAFAILINSVINITILSTEMSFLYVCVNFSRYFDPKRITWDFT